MYKRQLQRQVEALEADPACGICYTRVRCYAQEEGRYVENYPMWLWMAPRCTIRFLDCETAVFRVLPEDVYKRQRCRRSGATL